MDKILENLDLYENTDLNIVPKQNKSVDNRDIIKMLLNINYITGSNVEIYNEIIKIVEILL